MASCHAWAQAWTSPALTTTMASQSRSNHPLMHCKQLQAGPTLSLLSWLWQNNGCMPLRRYRRSADHLADMMCLHASCGNEQRSSKPWLPDHPVTFGRCCCRGGQTSAGSAGGPAAAHLAFLLLGHLDGCIQGKQCPPPLGRAVLKALLSKGYLQDATHAHCVADWRSRDLALQECHTSSLRCHCEQEACFSCFLDLPGQQYVQDVRLILLPAQAGSCSNRTGFLSMSLKCL